MAFPVSFVNDFSAFLGVQTVVMWLTLEGESEDLAQVKIWEMKSLCELFSGEMGSSDISSVWLPEDEKLLVAVTEENSCTDLLQLKLGFRSNVNWLTNQLNVTTEVPKQLRLDSNWYSVQDLDNGVLTVQEHYRVKQGPVITNTLGSWTNESGLDIKVPGKWERRSDLMGAILINTVLTYVPFSIVSEDFQDFDGFTADIFFALKKSLNFTYSLTSPLDEEWGLLKQDANGSSYWSGMVGQLALKQADLCTAALSIRRDRQEVIDFTTAALEELVTLIVAKSPATRHVDMMTYLVALRPMSWVVLFMFCIVVLFICSTIMIVGTVDKLSCSAISGELKYSVALLYRSFLQLGSDIPERPSWAFRLFFTTTSIWCFLMFQLYTGNMTASMTADSSFTSMKSFQDVIQTEFNVISGEGAATESFYQQAPTDSAMGQIYKKRLRLLNMGEGYVDQFVDMVRSGKSVIYESIYPFLGHGDLRVLMGFQDKITTQVGIGLQKDSELKDLFDYHIVKLRETGFMAKMRKKWLEHDTPKDYSDRIFVQEPLVLGFDNLFFPSFLLLVGIFCSVSFSLLEKFARRSIVP